MAISTPPSKGLATKSSPPMFTAMMTLILSAADDRNRMGAAVCFRSSLHQ